MKKLTIISAVLFISINLLCIIIPQKPTVNYSSEVTDEGLKTNGSVSFPLGAAVNFFGIKLQLAEKVHEIESPITQVISSKVIVKEKLYSKDGKLKINWLSIPLGFMTILLTLCVLSKLIKKEKETITIKST